MKKGTFAITQNQQAQAFHEIFKNNDGGVRGRIKGINNTPSLVSLFPKSPMYDTNQSLEKDRGKLFNAIEEYQIGSDKKNDVGNLKGILDDDTVYLMYKNVIDGYDAISPHVTEQSNTSNNYNWLYREQPMDMNFNYLKPNGAGSFSPSSPTAAAAPVGSNAPIPNAPDDKPFWGHANLQVPSVNPLEVRDDHENKPQLQRGSGGFGTSKAVSNRAFASQEKIGSYFTNAYVNNVNNTDRFNIWAGKSIDDEANVTTGDNAPYIGDVDNDGNPKQ